LRSLFRLAVVLLVSVQAGAAVADHIDPFALAEKAAEAYRKNDSYPEVRGMFSQALRDARHNGKLSPDFAIIYAMYADITRFDGNPSFALQLADEGIDLVLSAPQPDDDMKNSLLVSRAYALADLGRYAEAVETVTITALWMGKRFGPEQRQRLEDDGKSWAKLVAGADQSLPSAAQLALDLARKAEQALAANDTQLALTLASRAMLPEGTGLPQAEVDFLNAWCQTISGAAYGLEGRDSLSVVALKRAAGLMIVMPWNGLTKPRLKEQVLNDPIWKRLVWDTFSHLASSATGTGDWQLATLAIDLASDFAATPEQRFAVLAQQAGIAFADGDYTRAEAAFRGSETNAIASGDATNAALSRLYIAIAGLAGGDGKPDGQEVRDLMQAATAAADIARDDPQMVEYILTTAVRMVVDKTHAYAVVMPMARRALDVFRQRQLAMADYDAGQEAGRRDRRRFLEIVIEGEYDTRSK
jgi:tetratricopeptide (TPR) repeat protein